MIDKREAIMKAILKPVNLTDKATLSAEAMSDSDDKPWQRRSNIPACILLYFSRIASEENPWLARQSRWSSCASGHTNGCILRYS